MPEVLVIGGGLAGISAAFAAQELGADVLIVEAGPRLGGILQPLATALGPIDQGPTTFSGRHADLWWLIHRCGLDAEAFRLAEAPRFLVRDGRLEGITPSLLALARTRALSRREKIRALAEVFVRTRPPAGPESLHDFFARRFGERVATGPVNAVLTGVFAGDLRRLDAARCLPAVVAAERQSGSVIRGMTTGGSAPTGRPGLWSLRGGLHTVGAAAAALPHHLGAPVTKIRAQGAGWRVETAQGAFEAGSVVVAAQAPAAGRLLGLPILEEAPYAPMAVVHWADEAGVSGLPAGFGSLAPAREGTFALGTLHTGEMLGEGHKRYATFVGGLRQPQRVDLPDDELVAGIQGDLRRLVGGRFGELLGVCRWDRAVYQPNIGHDPRPLANPAPGLFLAGSYLGSSAMKDAVASGRVAGTLAAAARIRQRRAA